MNIIGEDISIKKTSISAVTLGKTSSRENCIKNLELNNFLERIQQTQHDPKNVKKKLAPKIITLECFELEKVLALIAYLEDILMSESFIGLEKETKCVEQLRVMRDIVNLTSYSDCFFHKNLLFRNMGYCYTFKGDIGRLYSYLPSVPKMSREIRYLLFHSIYKDVDMVNAHPSILAKYAFERELKTPTLLRLVNDRDNFYYTIAQETNTDINDVKKKVLMTVNQTEKMFFARKPKGSLVNLFKDILLIRNEIFNETSLKNEHFLFDKRKYKTDDIERKKVSIQSFFCQTKESESLLNLYTFLKSKQEEEIIDSYYLPLVFIPFFDGAYIWYDNLVHQVNVGRYIEEYNTQSEFIKFKEKIIEKEENILCEEKFNRYVILSAYLKKISYKETYKILARFHIPFTLLTEELLDSILKESTDLQNENYELSEEISALRKLFGGKKTTQEKKKEYRKQIDSLVIERRSTYNYILKGDLRSEVTYRVKSKLFGMRQVLLEHSTDEKTLSTFINEVLLADAAPTDTST